MTKIKICGIRTPAEAEYLNRYPVDYAGIVLYEKSKRYVPFEEIQDIFKNLNQDIIKITVAVSPDENMIRRAAQAGFDVLQIHGDYDRRLFQKKPDQLKLWRAVNVDNVNDLLQFDWEEAKAFDAVLLDAKNFGSGQTFGWDSVQNSNFRERLRAQGISFVLAGGLTADNVSEGIRIFEPDIVDVSSGVENETGKDEEKIRRFVEQVKNI